MTTSNVFFHDQPARGDWNRAFPAGNGRLGAMVFGDIDEERIALNDDTLYSGGARDRHNPDARPNLERIRKLVFDGQLAEAERINREAMTGLPPIMRNYEPLGDVLISQSYGTQAYSAEDGVGLLSQDIADGKTGKANFSEYRRTLDLERAVIETSFEAGGVNYQRELLVSRPDDLVVMRLSASELGALNLQIRLERGDDKMYSTRHFDTITASGNDRLVLEGQTGSGEPIRFAAALRVVTTGGEMETLGESVFVHGADEVLLYICGHTSESVEQPVSVLNEKLQTIPAWGSLMEQHVKDYQKLYQSVDLKLKTTNQASSSVRDQTSCVDLPVDQRLQRMAKGHEDLDLEVMYFNFGRYLLISCSRPGTRAANLQGIWNPSFSPSWGSKYTININIQMNYWIAEVCGLSECHEPLFDLISGIHKRGRETAKRMYGARGFVCHHNTDNTHDTCPTDRNVTASYWVMGGAWLALHLWERYQFSRDKEFLDQYYEILYDATLFFVDFLVEDDKGRLVTCPSVSPENAYRLPSGEIGTICAGPTMDNAIIRELTQACIAAAGVLGKDVPPEFENILKKLPALEIGKHGQLMEWADDLDEVEQGHRHISHLFALHPGSQIDPLETPEFSEAAAVTLQRRLASGGGHTGWSRAWIALFFCRLHDGENAHKNLKSLLSHSTLPNMLDDHPPFQIDGNFGGASAVTEMLIQSQHSRIELLPALPSAWATGSVSGLRVRGGASVDMQWRDGQLNRVCIRASVAGRFVLCHGERLKRLDLQSGEQCVIDW